MKRKIKLTKLTIANLDHVKGGYVHNCGCPVTDPGLGQLNLNLTAACTISACAPLCEWDKIQ
ncbi:MAG: hypothetical protein MUF15_16880 [Acidobacteria bacterium]|jgi:hypothetical protein|nr:hypothetical protein [Acidobacteriota bacterium]